MTKITVSNAKKIAMKFFRSEMTPPSLSEIFRKFIRFRIHRLPLLLLAALEIFIGPRCPWGPIYGLWPMSVRQHSFHFRSEKIHCNYFCFRKGNFGHEFPEKASKRGGVISDLKNFIANLVLVQPVCGKNRNIFFRKRGGGRGGGAGAVRKFSGNSSVLVCTGFP